jgi:peroxiredoxin
VRADVQVGRPFPDYQLPDHEGVLRTLSEIQGQDPMVVVLAREAYSAKDQVQHEGLVQLWREMKPGVGYCRMVTITATDPQEAFNYRNGVGAEWPFLADPERVVQRDLDIVEYTDPLHNQMVPHTIVCEPGLLIFKIYNGFWFFGRPTVEELRHDLRAVLMKHHWDWDLSRPDVKAAWEHGERDRFYPPERGWPKSEPELELTPGQREASPSAVVANGGWA